MNFCQKSSELGMPREYDATQLQYGKFYLPSRYSNLLLPNFFYNSFLQPGGEVKTYQATQMQRAMEREVRKAKQGLEMAKAADDAQLEAQYQKMITAQNRRLKSFCESTGLPRQRFRERVTG